MNENMTPSQTNPAASPKNGCGCIFKALAGIAILALALLVASWLLLMHSSVPLRSVASMIEEAGAASHLKVTGVSGSLSSGLSFDKMVWDDGEMADVRVRYSGIMDLIRRKRLILHEVHVGKAVFSASFRDNTTTEEEPASSSQAGGKTSDPPLKLFQIDRLSLNNILIKDNTTGATLEIPKLEWTGFKAENGRLELGKLDAESDHLSINTTAAATMPYDKRFEIAIMPKMHERIRKPIRIVIESGYEGGELIFDLKAFDGALQLSAADGLTRIRTEGLNLADFIDAPLPNQLQLDADIAEPTFTVRAGSFLLGAKSFEIRPTTVSGKETEGTAFLAIHRAGDTEIRYEISEGKEQSFTPVLTSTPAMSPEDIMALLFHDRDFAALPPPDQEKLRKHMTWFSFSR